jgi:hypothetical protein
LLPLQIIQPRTQLLFVESPDAGAVVDATPDLDGAGNLTGFRHLLHDALAQAGDRARGRHLDPLGPIGKRRRAHCSHLLRATGHVRTAS